MASKEYTLDEIGKNIDKLTQLHDLTSIETTLFATYITVFIFGVTLYATSNNPLWKPVSLLIMGFAYAPIVLLIRSTSLSDASSKVENLETILVIVLLHLIGIAVMLGAVRIIISFNLISNVGPLLIISTFQLWAIFLYFWYHHFEPGFRKRFSHLITKRKKESEIKKIIKVIFWKSFLPLTILSFLGVVIWCLSINENIQAIIISVIGIVDIIYLTTRGEKKKKGKEIK